MQERVAVAWVLLVALGLLLGLLVAVVAFGVVRHLRRSRRSDRRPPPAANPDPSDDIERPGGFSRPDREDDPDS